jgi:hypothetical protein
MIMILGALSFGLLTLIAFLAGFRKVGLVLLVCTGIGILANVIFYVSIVNSRM